MSFEFATAGRIIFGPGVLQQLGPLAAEMGRKALVTLGLERDQAEGLLAALSASGVETSVFRVSGEPTTDLIRRGTAQARQAGCDLVVGFGGGSAIDTGKAIAAMLTNPGDVLDYLEVVGAGQQLQRPTAPFIAIPTTAGTGAEVTRNAVLGVPEKSVKVSLRSPLMLPRLALVDPELTYSLPPAVTASTGLDALTQLIEPYVSKRANPITDAFCREGLPRAARALPRAYRQSDDAEARQEMSLAALLGGLALANAKLGAVHGFAGVLGGMLNAPHGAICAALLPHVMETNLQALRQRAPQSNILMRYTEVARMLTGDPDAGPEDGVSWVRQLCRDLQVPLLSTYGLTPDLFPDLIAKSARSSSMQGNPIALSAEELAQTLAAAG